MRLRCPGCGAPSRTGAARCDYCRARLATISCPACFALMFEGSKFCPHCGAARGRGEAAETDQGQPARCPACRSAMRWITIGDLDLLECEQCDGTWVEAAAFEALCASRESQAAVLHANPGERATAGKSETPRYRPCLRCGTLMNRMNFGRHSGTIVDVCRGHGTFLDRGELHQVVRFVHEGGLDRTRRAEIEELREEQRRLQALQHQAGRPQSIAGSFAWDDHWFRDFMKALIEK
jgi:Zn-finger nucleic acid-binding protein